MIKSNVLALVIFNEDQYNIYGIQILHILNKPTFTALSLRVNYEKSIVGGLWYTHDTSDCGDDVTIVYREPQNFFQITLTGNVECTLT
jgi:hypothetical protein